MSRYTAYAAGILAGLIVLLSGLHAQEAVESGPSSAVLGLQGRQKVPVDVQWIRDGILHVESDWLRGPANIRTDSIESVRMDRVAPRPEADDLLTLANDDVLPGKVLEIGAEAVRLRSPFLGELNVPRRFVDVVRMGGGNALRRTGFHDGSLDPWKASRDGWNVTDGVLWGYGTLSAEADQDEPFTVQVELHSRRRFPWFQLGLLASQGKTVRERGVLVVQSKWGRLQVVRWEQGGHSDMVANHILTDEQKKLHKIKLCVALDPGTGQFKVWIGQEKVFDSTALYEGKQDGRFIVLGSDRSGVAAVNVVEGMVQPEEWTLAAPERDQNTVMLTNGDRLGVPDLHTEEDELVLDMGGMELRVPVEKLDQIVFAADENRELPGAEGLGVVQAAGGRLSMTIDRLEGGRLLGETAWGEPVSVRAEALQRLTFGGSPQGEVQNNAVLRLPERHSAAMRLLGIQDGAVVFDAPWLKGQARAELAALEAVDHDATAVPVPESFAVMTNGDTIGGEMRSLTSEALVMESQSLGQVSLPRRALDLWIAPDRHGTILRPDFRTGRIEPMKMARGKQWEVKNGKLRIKGFGLLSMEFNQDKPFTVHIDAEATSKRAATFVLSLFGKDDKNHGPGVMSMFMNASNDILMARAGIPAPDAEGREPAAEAFRGKVDLDAEAKKKTSITLAIDPENDVISVWLNGEQVLDQGELPPRNPDGRFMTLLPHSAALTDVAVRHELLGPEDFSPPEELPDSYVLRLSNRETVQASDVVFEQGQFVAVTEQGERRIPAEQVFGLLFPTTDPLEAPQQAVQVQTPHDRLTMAISGMDEQSLRGTTSYMEQVRVHTDAVERIEIIR